MKVENTFNSIIKNHPATCYYIACSGGVDSMVLLFLAQTSRLPIHVLHVNYNLRGDESKEDALFIENYCKSKYIPISIYEVQLGQILAKNGGNLQNEARTIRYDFFNQKMDENPGSKLLTGQHLNDQIETFWLQLYRGAGLKGMAGMEVERNNILRPLLSLQKAELIEFARQNALSWREDRSNEKSDYQRNKWRNVYLPELRKSIPTIDDSVQFMQEVFLQNLETIDLKINEITEEILEYNSIHDDQIGDLQLTELAELFRKLSIPLNLILPFAKLIKSQKGTRIEWFGLNKEKFEIIRESNGFSFRIKNQDFQIPEITSELVSTIPATFDKYTFYFSPKKIMGNVFLRTWKEGDRIYPIGLAGSKLISDVLTDAKIKNAQRASQLVLCDEEKILACIGCCIDRRAVSKNETPIMKISIVKP